MMIVRKSLTQEAAETMVHAFVTSRMDYCNSILYGASAPLQNVFNAAARLILHKGKYDRITAAIRDSLHWLPVQQRIEYKICVLVYKCPTSGSIHLPVWTVYSGCYSCPRLSATPLRPVDQIDKAAYHHDLTYVKYKNKMKRIEADRLMIRELDDSPSHTARADGEGSRPTHYSRQSERRVLI